MDKQVFIMGTWSNDLLVCLLPRVSMIKHNNNNVTIHVRYLINNHSIKKFWWEKHLQIHEKAYQTLVVNLPMTRRPYACQKWSSSSVAPHSKSKYPRQKIKESLSQESKLCYIQMRVKRPLFISFSWPLIYKNRSTKQPTRLTFTKCHYLSLYMPKCQK